MNDYLWNELLKSIILKTVKSDFTYITLFTHSFKLIHICWAYSHTARFPQSPGIQKHIRQGAHDGRGGEWGVEGRGTGEGKRWKKRKKKKAGNRQLQPVRLGADPRGWPLGFWAPSLPGNFFASQDEISEPKQRTRLWVDIRSICLVFLHQRASASDTEGARMSPPTAVTRASRGMFDPVNQLSEVHTLFTLSWAKLPELLHSRPSTLVSWIQFAKLIRWSQANSVPARCSPGLFRQQGSRRLAAAPLFQPVGCSEPRWLPCSRPATFPDTTSAWRFNPIPRPTRTPSWPFLTSFLVNPVCHVPWFRLTNAQLLRQGAE